MTGEFTGDLFPKHQQFLFIHSLFFTDETSYITILHLIATLCYINKIVEFSLQ